MSEIVITNQWSDFLIRQVDPYAFAKYKILLSWLKNISNKEILVIGSGSGEFTAMLAKQGALVTALDISQECIDLTLATAKQFQVNVQTVVASLENFHSEKMYDVIVATDVIEHIENDNEACKKINSLLKTDGQLIITVPALQYLFGYHDEILGHYRRYSKRQLLQLVKKYFSVKNCRYYGFLLIPVALVISRWLRKPYPVQKVGHLSEKEGLLPKIVRFVFQFEQKISLPSGTSLLLYGTKTS